jgi:hypothetical protein
LPPAPQLHIKLLQGWVDAPDAKGKWTYTRTASKSSGTFQVTYALNNGYNQPLITSDMLLDMCRKMGNSVKEGRINSQEAGPCDFGTFATMQFHGRTPAHLQIWVLTNQKHFILVTHMCMAPPDPQEVTEADQMARALRLIPAPSQ